MLWSDYWDVASRLRHTLLLRLLQLKVLSSLKRKKNSMAMVTKFEVHNANLGSQIALYHKSGNFFTRKFIIRKFLYTKISRSTVTVVTACMHTTFIQCLTCVTHSSESLVGDECLRRDILGLAERADELVLTEVLLDALIAEALAAALDDHRILHELLADWTHQLVRHV